MKKILLTVFVFLVSLTFIQAQEVNVSTYLNAPTPEEDSVLTGLTSIRGANYHDDLIGNGVSAIGLTNYQYYTVAVYGTVGNDAIELKWISPTNLDGSGSSPRYVVFGDLDNDGRNEVIYQVSNVGIVIFEWDGVADSWNFGDQPSQTIDLEALGGTNNGNAEYMEVLDIDNDGKNELLVAFNGSGSDHDNYYIVSAVGEWETGNPVFSGILLEGIFKRSETADWGVGGGSPYDLIASNLDGVDNPEIILHNWNNKNVVPIRVPAADTYEISDVTNGKQNLMLTPTDNVALFSGISTDIDGDGRDEVYLPTYDGNTDQAPEKGYVHMIHYEDGQSTEEIDSTNSFVIDMSSVSGVNQFGIGYGDLDGNGKPNLYVAGGKGHNVISTEFQGGVKTDPNNWVHSIVYENETDIYSTINYRDSSGVLDTVYTTNSEFVSKIFAKNTDFDKDGKQDLLMPYQGVNDSTDVVSLSWNGATFDTVSAVKIVNPKAWGFRILEGSTGVGVKAKEMTIINPSDYVLEQNYPNPFNPTTNIRFSLPANNSISLTIYDMIGQEVKTLISKQEFTKGSYVADWNGTNNAGQKVASGNYIYTLRYGNFQKSVKMTLLK